MESTEVLEKGMVAGKGREVDEIMDDEERDREI